MPEGAGLPASTLRKDTYTGSSQPRPSQEWREKTMPYLAAHPEAWVGKFAPPNNECVSLVKTAAGAPQTARWRKGAAVRGNLLLAKGTAIATFDGTGRYASNPRGNHAAIYIRQDGTGIWVYDQWAERPKRKAKAVSERLIGFRGGQGSATDDGDAYSVIE